MKKMISSSKMTFIFALLFSLFIVACMHKNNSPEYQVSYLETKDLSRASSKEKSCTPVPIENQGCVNSMNQVISVELPASGRRPECGVNVTADIIYCEDKNGTVTLLISNFRVGQLCPELLSYLNSFNNVSDQNKALDMLFYDLSQLAEQKEVDILLNENINSVIAEYYSALCYKRCLWEGAPVTTLCGDMCCVRTTKYTLVNGQKQGSEPTFETKGTSCGSDTDCNGTTVSSCMHTCGNPRGDESQ